MEKLRLKEALVVEGRYDKNTLSQLVDCVILETRGFGIFKDRELIGLLRFYADTRGLIILTDGDGAGFQIRNRIRSAIPAGNVKHAYIPDVFGKEKRKKNPSKEGKLGVEGMSPQILRDCLLRAGATFEEDQTRSANCVQLSKADFYEMGFSGGPGSAAKREALAKQLALPVRLSADGLLDAINTMLWSGSLTPEAFRALQKDAQDPSEG